MIVGYAIPRISFTDFVANRAKLDATLVDAKIGVIMWGRGVAQDTLWLKPRMPDTPDAPTIAAYR